ncbi:MAG: NADH-quinone oxidoreductase subunit C [Promethearchaeota archaeon]
MNIKNRLLKDIRNTLGNEYQGSTDLIDHKGILIETNRMLIKDVSQVLAKYKNMVFNGIFPVELSEKFLLYYYYSLDLTEENLNIIIRTKLDKEVRTLESISDIIPAADAVEKRMHYLYDIIFIKSIEEEDRSIFCNPYKIIPPTRDVNPFALGIFDMIHLNNYYFEFELEEGRVKYISLKDGWQFQNTIKSLQNSDIDRINSVIAHIHPLSSIHYSLVFNMAVESLLNIKVTTKARFIRTLLAELERINNHLIWMANLFNLLDFKKVYVNLIKYRHDLINVFKEISGNIFLDNTIKLGGVVDISSEQARKLKNTLINIKDNIINEIYKHLYHSFTREKTQNIGVINYQEAKKYGVNGPAIRATGVPMDVRYTTPYLAYNAGELSKRWEVVTFTGGDTFARAQVRFWEINESFNICEYILNDLEFYDNPVKVPHIDMDNIKFPAKTSVIKRVEAPNGQLSIMLYTDKNADKGKIQGFYLITPSFKNYFALKNVLLNEYIRDVIPAIHSFDLEFSEIDL